MHRVPLSSEWWRSSFLFLSCCSVHAPTRPVHSLNPATALPASPVHLHHRHPPHPLRRSLPSHHNGLQEENRQGAPRQVLPLGQRAGLSFPICVQAHPAEQKVQLPGHSPLLDRPLRGS